MLYLPPVSYRDVQNNLAATPTPGSVGTVVTGSATANTKGAWATLVAALNFEAEWMNLMISNTAASATRTDALLDIGVGGAGSEVVILPDLLAGWAGRGDGGARQYSIPIYLPKGTRVAARCQGVQVSKTVGVGVWFYGGARQPSMPTFSGADAIGVTNSGASNGTSHTPGNTGVESAWASVGGTTARDYKALLFMVQGTLSVTVTTAIGYHFEIGWNSTTIAEFFVAAQTTEVVYGPFPGMPVFHSVPAGTQLQVRAEASGTAQAYDVALYGMW